MIKQVISLCEGTKYLLTDLSNISSYLFETLENVNWVGFYIVKDNNLHLGPFQGKVACTYIPFSKGVCGTCLKDKKAIYVPNVEEFPGHIACDSASKSEFVIPIFKNNEVFIVLDIDKLVINGFSIEEQKELIEIAKFIESIINKQHLL